MTPLAQFGAACSEWGLLVPRRFDLATAREWAERWDAISVALFAEAERMDREGLFSEHHRDRANVAEDFACASLPRWAR